MSTPAHIVPEWYFLWVYAILRSIPNKLGGVAAIALVFVCLLALPFLNTSQVRSSKFRPIYTKLFWLFFDDCLLLGWGPVELYFYWTSVYRILFSLFFSINPKLREIRTPTYTISLATGRHRPST